MSNVGEAGLQPESEGSTGAAGAGPGGGGGEPTVTDTAPPRGLSAVKVVALVVAFMFLGGAIGWALAQDDGDPFSAVDVGFMQDMGYHHIQAVEMSVAVLIKDSVGDEIKHFAQEITITQQYERGLFNAMLDRFGHPSMPESEAMGWMGPPVPLDDMMGLATEEQMDQLREAEGVEADALWIALMTEHHLGGLHMADYAARHGQDEAVSNIARNMVRVQRAEILDLERYRRLAGLPFPEGFGDPMGDQRLNPLSLQD